MTAVDPALLDAVEQAHAAATKGEWVSGLGDFPSSVWRGDASVAIASRPENAASIVALHNAAPDLIRAARERDALRTAVLALADQWERLARGNEKRADELAAKGDDPHAEYRSGRADSYAQGAERLRAVVETHLGAGDA